MTAFEDLLAPFMGGRGSQQRLAKKLGMTASGFGRGVKAGTLSVENLLTLARETGLSPSRVLRAGGKTEFAELIEQLYGQENSRTISDAEWVVIRALRALPDEKRLAAEGFIGYQSAQTANPHSPRMPEKRSYKRKLGEPRFKGL